MPETPKEKPEIEEGEKDANDKTTWIEDQKTRGYYYDDAHGYETYDPDEDEKEEAEEKNPGQIDPDGNANTINED